MKRVFCIILLVCFLMPSLAFGANACSACRKRNHDRCQKKCAGADEHKSCMRKCKLKRCSVECKDQVEKATTASDNTTGSTVTITTSDNTRPLKKRAIKKHIKRHHLKR